MIRKIFEKIKVLFSRNIYGFISPSVTLSLEDQNKINDLIDNPDVSIVEEFENQVASYIGHGKVVSFAACRMAFYALLKAWNVGVGDEVILTGFTCSVMANAVMRVGAIILYADIDKNTLGTTPNIEKLISNKTKVIVAQHTFGIPCRIDEIMTLAKKHNIKVVEDCAISFGSKYKDIRLGNWGNAAIFSTDHTKPLNTLIGGFCYTSEQETFNLVKAIHDASEELAKDKLKAAVKRYVLESQFERTGYKRYILLAYWTLVKRKLNICNLSPYMDGDDTAKTTDDNYPYPSKFSSALAFIGIKSLQQYKENEIIRKNYTIKIVKSLEGKGYIPSMLYNKDAEILALRIPLLVKKDKLKDFPVDHSFIWYKKPIVNTFEPLESFGYKLGMCPISEIICDSIMNIPINYDDLRMREMIKILNNI